MSGFLILLPSNSLFVPHELSERILHNLKVDFKSLASSALVCQSWAFASRRCLFENMTISPQLAQRFLELSSLLSGTAGSKTPPATTYCRALHIRNVFSQSAFCPFINPEPSALLQSPLRPLFSILTTLTISHCQFPSLEMLMIFVSCFSILESLSFDEVVFGKESATTKISPSTTLSSVTSLSVRNLDTRQFFSFVNQANLLGNVTHISLGPAGQRDIPYAAKYILRISSILEQIHVQFTEAKSGQDYICGIVPIMECPPACLQSVGRSPTSSSTSPSNAVRDEYRRIWGIETSVYPLPKLTTLQVQDFLHVHKGPMQASARFWTPRFITSMIPPSLQRIELGMTLDRAGQLDQYEVNWKFLDYALNSEDYASLRRLVFCVDGAVDLDNLGNLISARLPLMTERGILEFCRTGSRGP